MTMIYGTAEGYAPDTQPFWEAPFAEVPANEERFEPEAEPRPPLSVAHARAVLSGAAFQGSPTGTVTVQAGMHRP